MTVASPALLVFALLAAIACAVIGRGRRPAVLLAIATFSAIAAAAGVEVGVGKPPRIAVLVDASPSTRGQWFRNVAQVRAAVDQITARLAPGAAVSIQSFADADAFDVHGSIAELPSDHTALPPVDAEAVLLLSDGHLDLAANAPPIYPVFADIPSAGDARITGVETDGDEVVLSVTNDGETRRLSWPDGTASDIPRGSIRLSHRAPAAVGIARLNARDLWPENDAVELHPPIQIASERWWIGDTPAPAGFRAISPHAMPASDDWLAARQVVINNVAAEAIDRDAMQGLVRYVRDFGGGLTIVGGNRAFSAGAYGGTELDVISPLASCPPEPRREWLVLIDASGSMAKRGEDGRSRLEGAIDAAAAAVATIPAADTVNVATFARDLQPWPALASRRVVAPPNLAATGPTNLRAALESILKSRTFLAPEARNESRGVPAPESGPKSAAESGPGTARLSSAQMPLRVIALTDGEASLDEPAGLGSRLKSAGVTIDWLQLDGERKSSLADVVHSSGGIIVAAGTTTHWRTAAISAVQTLERIPAAAPVPIRWIRRGLAADVAPATTANGANTTWIRQGAEPLAVLEAPAAAPAPAAVVARWRVGSGQVIAAAYAASPSAVERLATSIDSSPRDSRFTVRWSGEQLILDARDGDDEKKSPMNDLKIELRDIDSAIAIPLVQTAPGRYSATVPAASRARIFATRVEGKTIDLHTVAGAPAAEFREIGIDRAALEALASRTGGRVLNLARLEGPPIAPAQRRASMFVPLMLLSALSAAAAITLGRR